MSSIWAWIFATLAVFFALAGRRYRQRGYTLLGAALGCTAAADALNTLVIGLGPTVWAFLAARLAVIVGVSAAGFNVHFMYVHFRAAHRARVAWVAYVLVGAAALADLTLSLGQFPALTTLAYPEQYRSPSTPFSIYQASIVLGHLVAMCWLLAHAKKAQRPYAGRLLITVGLTGPAVIFDIISSFLYGRTWFLAEACTWIYALVILGNLISEIQGAEGLLQATASSLEERTKQLESSYAEIDFMANELSRKQQLAAVGELAASIAHEVRNPLAIIMNAVSAMKRPTLALQDRETLLDIVNEESERLNHLVTELLRFARPVTASRGPASLFDICQRASETPPDGYSLIVSTPQDDALGPVLVDPGLFRLALDNLIANSCQAMPQGGTIELTVRSGHFADGTPAATVDVRDSGCGMKAEELSSARKPFFTTKPRGTGLGIPIADRIVEAHGGEMSITSVLGQGTTVSINLPIEKELKKAPTYSGSLNGRRRLRSIPPGSSESAENATFAGDGAFVSDSAPPSANAQGVATSSDSRGTPTE